MLRGAVFRLHDPAVRTARPIPIHSRIMRWLTASRAAGVGVAALFVVTVILVILALRPVEPPPATEPAYVPDPTTTTEPTPAPTTTTPEPSEEPTSPSEEPAVVIEPVQRLLTVASADIAWRATVGACDEPGTVEVTSDGGETWNAVDPDLAPVMRLKALDEDSVFAIGGGDGCAASFRISGTAGSEWTSDEAELTGAWYREPAEPDVVHGPVDVAAPCANEVADLAGLSTTVAAVVCTDGSIQQTDDGGSSWSALGTLEGAVALGPQLSTDADFQGYLIASLESGCEGVAIRSVGTDGGGLDGDPVSCVDTGEVAPGQVAVALNGEVAWLWAGDSLLISTDGGATW